MLLTQNDNVSSEIKYAGLSRCTMIHWESFNMTISRFKSLFTENLSLPC